MRNRSAQVVRSLVPALQIESLDSEGVTTGQNHGAVARNGQPTHVGHQAIVPEDLGLEAISTSRELQIHAHQHSEGGSTDRHRPVGQELKVGKGLNGLQFDRRACRND